MKAVVIDDERTIRNVLKKVLTKEKIDTVLLDSGKNALKVISKEKPNIVFLDISLKDSNGIEILKEITQLEEPPYIVMISGHDEYNYLIEAMKLGAYDYIPKPFDINRIRAVVDEIRKSLDSEINPIDFNLDIVGKSPATDAKNAYSFITNKLSSGTALTPSLPTVLPKTMIGINTMPKTTAI
jgi:two-component system nitrogen regulation response regulator GlnG